MLIAIKEGLELMLTVLPACSEHLTLNEKIRANYLTIALQLATKILDTRYQNISHIELKADIKLAYN